MEDNTINIKAIENKYGLVPLKMALTYLVEVGAQFFYDEETVEEFIELINAKEKSVKVKGVATQMSRDFQCNVVRCAAELSQFSVWELFAYIKKYGVVWKN